MKKSLSISLALVCMMAGQLHAGTVSVSDAQTVALNFFKVNTNVSATRTATLTYTKTTTTNAVAFYVFDVNPDKGFVIVAGDDNVIPVLGYSTQGTFHIDPKHEGINHWINTTTTNIQLALQHNVVADARISGEWSAYRQGLNPYAQRSGSVTPLCTTTWDQENDVSNPPPFLYNQFCPYNNRDQQRALTGCEATAMAQIMKFWNYPAQGVDSFSYADTRANGYSGNYGTLSSDFSTHTYQWTSMPDVLTGAETAAEDSAVALLMYDCGVSVGMDYGDDNEDGSAANGLISLEYTWYGDSLSVENSLIQYFGYDTDTIGEAYQSAYTATSWTTLIEHELNMGRPVLYEGNDPTQGGHAWVCDGYDASDKLHMNWGWGGQDNGYFAINNLTTSGNFNPIDSDDALIGIMPKVARTTGIKSGSNSVAFNIYPNPAVSEVILQTTDASNAVWSLQNVMGQTLVSKSAEALQTHLDISSYAPGIYFVELRVGDITSVRKLLINK